MTIFYFGYLKAVWLEGKNHHRSLNSASPKMGNTKLELPGPAGSGPGVDFRAKNPEKRPENFDFYTLFTPPFLGRGHIKWQRNGLRIGLRG